MADIELTRQLIAIEDLLLGPTTDTKQNRGGQSTSVTGITAAALGGVYVTTSLNAVNPTYVQKFDNFTVLDLSTGLISKFNKTTAQWEVVVGGIQPRVREVAEAPQVKVEVAPQKVYDDVSKLPRGTAQHGEIAVVTGKRGGIFIYDEGRKDDWDGGTAFFGWLRYFSGPAMASWYDEAHIANLFNHRSVYLDVDVAGVEIKLGQHKVKHISGDCRLGTMSNPVHIVGELGKPTSFEVNNGKAILDKEATYAIGEVRIGDKSHSFFATIDIHNKVDISEVVKQHAAIPNAKFRADATFTDLSELVIEAPVYFKELKGLANSSIKKAIPVYGADVSMCIDTTIKLASRRDRSIDVSYTNCKNVKEIK